MTVIDIFMGEFYLCFILDGEEIPYKKFPDNPSLENYLKYLLQQLQTGPVILEEKIGNYHPVIHRDMLPIIQNFSR